MSSSSASPPLWSVTLPVTFASTAFLFLLVRYALRSYTARRRCLVSRTFPLEAGLGILAVATGLDITVSAANMGVFDHLSKLSSIHLVCITMHLALPSLGTKNDRSIVLAVVTLTANVFSLLTAAVTYGWRTPASGGASSTRFKPDYLASTIVTLLLFGILVSHSLMTLVVKQTLQSQFKAYGAPIWYRYRTCEHDTGNCICFVWDKSKENVMRYWTLAVTANPDRSLRASGAPLVSAILCWGFNGVALLTRVASLMLYSTCCKDWGKYFSSYRSSASLLIFLLQSAGLVVGLVASIARGLNYNPFSEAAPLLDIRRARNALLYFETTRFSRLVDWKEPIMARPTSSSSKSGSWKSILGSVGLRIRASLVDVLILLQLGLILFMNSVLVFASASELILSILPASLRVDGNLGVGHINAWEDRAQKLGGYEASLRKGYNRGYRNTSSKQEKRKLYDRRRPFVLHLGSIKIDREPLLGGWANLPEKWIRSGGKTKPEKLCELLEESSARFQEVRDFIKEVGKIKDRAMWKGQQDLKYAPVSHTLIIAILTRIIHVKFLKSHGAKVLHLVEQAKEGIKYASFVEKHVRSREVKNSIRAANMIIAEISKDDEDQVQETDYSKFLSELIYNERAEEWKVLLDGLMSTHVRSPSVRARWALAYRWSHVLLVTASPLLKAFVELTAKDFERDKRFLANVIGNCLMDLPKAIISVCYYAEYGEKEEEVYEAAIMLGEVEDVLNKLREKWGNTNEKVR